MVMVEVIFIGKNSKIGENRKVMLKL